MSFYGWKNYLFSILQDWVTQILWDGRQEGSQYKYTRTSTKCPWATGWGTVAWNGFFSIIRLNLLWTRAVVVCSVRARLVNGYNSILYWEQFNFLTRITLLIERLSDPSVVEPSMFVTTSVILTTEMPVEGLKQEIIFICVPGLQNRG
jgi:hypothetical protein